MVSMTTVSPGLTVSTGFWALSYQPHCVVSIVAGRMWTAPCVPLAGTTLSAAFVTRPAATSRAGASRNPRHQVMALLPLATYCSRRPEGAATIGRNRRRPRRQPSMSWSLGRLPQALRQQAVNVLLGLRDRAHAAVHAHAGEPIGVEPRDLLFAFQPFDHRHRGAVHGLVEVGVLDVGDIVLGGLRRRPFHVLLVARLLGAQAVNALLDVDHLRDAAIRYGRHQLRRLIGRDVALLRQELDGLRLGAVPGLVQVLVEAHGDP